MIGVKMLALGGVSDGWAMDALRGELTPLAQGALQLLE